jgi:hypothetical protein
LAAGRNPDLTKVGGHRWVCKECDRRRSRDYYRRNREAVLARAAERRGPAPTRFCSEGDVELVVIGWIGQTLIFGWYARSVANFRTAVGSLEVFIFLATYFYIAAIVLLVAMELDELVRVDLQRSPSRRKLLPLVAGVIRGADAS